MSKACPAECDERVALDALAAIARSEREAAWELFDSLYTRQVLLASQDAGGS